MNNLYWIENCGCDDETDKAFEFTDEEVAFLVNVFNKLNAVSTYGCMPTIHLYKLEPDDITVVEPDYLGWDRANDLPSGGKFIFSRKYGWAIPRERELTSHA